MKKTVKYTGTAICIMLAFACSKQGPVLPTIPITDVYISGDSSITGYNSVVKYWKNGIPVNCSDGKSQNFPLSLAVSGSNVYMAGYLIEANQWYAMAWKNGKGNKLSTEISGSNANSVKVSGNDVYYGGSIGNTKYTCFATYWKNGIPTSVSDGKSATYVQDMAVIGSDVYLLLVKVGMPVHAEIWKNGVIIESFKTNGKDGDYIIFNEIAVSNSDVYLSIQKPASNGNALAGYYKNGVPVTFSDSTRSSYAASICVAGNDVYVAGFSSRGIAETPGYNIATYWKNGTAVYLTDGTNEAVANSIKVVGTDVYVAGFLRNKGINEAIYWKNGVPFLLSHGSSNSSASNIAIVEH